MFLQTTNVTTRTKTRGRRQLAESSSILVPAMQAAKQYGIPYTTLRDLAFRGEIPVLRLGKAWYFERRDLAKFIERSKETLNR